MANVEDYYLNNNGMESYPEGPPAAPDPSEGFQVKMGPFFIAPMKENELFQKYELSFSDNFEVHRVDVDIAPFSHHFIMYDYNSRPEANGIEAGYRDEGNHSETNLVIAVQEKTDLNLPKGTAFFWDDDLVLDLNSHYINYSTTHTYKAETYVNLYTQPKGTAAQEMRSFLLPNYDILIPNNGNTTRFEAPFSFGNSSIFVWGVMGHTHQYGTGYKVYLRNADGSKGDLMYDAACPRGIPNCISPFFDYRHIPMRYIEPLFEVPLSKGIIHEATWLNDGPKDLRWGDTSKDEMMVMIVMYTDDTTGITTATKEIFSPEETAEIFPNPMSEVSTVRLSSNWLAGQGGSSNVQQVRLRLFDLMGKEVRTMEGIREREFQIEKGNLGSGIYLYRIEDKDGRMWSGKLVVK
jgi:hypothetical protein